MVAITFAAHAFDINWLTCLARYYAALHISIKTWLSICVLHGTMYLS